MNYDLAHKTTQMLLMNLKEWIQEKNLELRLFNRITWEQYRTFLLMQTEALWPKFCAKATAHKLNEKNHKTPIHVPSCRVQFQPTSDTSDTANHHLIKKYGETSLNQTRLGWLFNHKVDQVKSLCAHSFSKIFYIKLINECFLLCFNIEAVLFEVVFCLKSSFTD